MNKEKAGYADRSVNNMKADKLREMKEADKKKSAINGKEKEGEQRD